MINKTTIVILFSIAFIGCSKKESNAGKEIDIQKINIFFAGQSGTEMMDKDTTVLWKNNVITKYDAGSRPSSIFIFDGKSYVSGIIEKDGITRACYWRDGKLVVLSNTENDAFTSSIYATNDNVYTAGHYKNKNNKTQACYWLNNKRVDLVQNENESCYTRKIYVSGNDIYIAGFSSYDKNGTQQIEACYWKNGIKVSLDSSPYVFSIATDIVLKENNVFILGRLDDSKHVCLCNWKNNKRTDLLEKDFNYNKEKCNIFISYQDADYIILTNEAKIFYSPIRSFTYHSSGDSLFIVSKIKDSLYVWENNNRFYLPDLGFRDIYSINSFGNDLLLLGSTQDSIKLFYKNKLIRSFNKDNFRPGYSALSY